MAQHSVGIGRNGLTIDGKPFYILSGCIHYFRWPRAEWRPLLEQARWAGLNTIDTVIPWNRHEPAPGQFDFTQEADLGAFLDLCQELGLYAIVRPGPYICAEWENGGIPAWLTAPGDLRLRTDDPPFLDATLRWFDTLMPILASRQLSRGGPIILCQVENEHWASGVYASDAHQDSLAQAAIDRGMDVPQYTCMGAMNGWPEFRNGWSGIAEKLVATRAVWPENPMIVSELWSGWFDNWGASRQTRKSPAKLDVTLHQLTAVGCSGFSHWMWAGGTNFGYWGGRTVGGDTIHMATSYDYDAPISEFGALTPKALVARRHHLFLASFGAELASVLADAVPGGMRILAPTAVRGRSEGGAEPYRTVRAGPDAPAAWRDFCCTYLQNPGLEGATYQVFTPAGAHLSVDVEPTTIRPIFANLPLGDTGVRIAHHTGRILGCWPGDEGDLLVVYGLGGEQGELALHFGDDPLDIELSDSDPAVRADLRDTTLTLRYWLTSFGSQVEVQYGDRTLTVLLLPQERADTFTIEEADLPALPAAAAPTPTIYLPLEGAPVAEVHTTEGWTPLAKPQPLEQLGCHYGYGWYRAELDLAAPLDAVLIAPWLSDRGLLLHNGAPLGTLGVDPAGPVYCLPLQLPAGKHDLRLLADNLGRFNYGINLGERKGLLDTLYLDGAQEDISTGWSALWQEVQFAGEAVANIKPWAVRPDAVEVDLGAFAFAGPSVWLLREISVQPGRRYIVHITGDRNSGGFFVNGSAVERFSRHRSGGVLKADITDQLRPGARNVLALNILNYAGAPWRATLVSYDPTRPLAAQWSFRAGVQSRPGGTALPAGVQSRPGGTALPAGAQSRPGGTALPAGVQSRPGGTALPGEDGPRFFTATFAREVLPEGLRALRLRVGGLVKGQIWLNERNIGRFWQIGPQEDYKLPVSWLADQNELRIFAETGSADEVVLIAEAHA